MLSCDTTGPSFSSTAPTPRIRGPFSLARRGIGDGRGREGGVLFSLRAARRQMLACSLPVIKRPPARLSPALCCAAKRRHAASCCGPWRSPRRCSCRARRGRSPRASSAVAGVWVFGCSGVRGGCDGACCRTPRAGGGRLTVPHRGRAPFDALPSPGTAVSRSPLPAWAPLFPGCSGGRASPAAGRWLRVSPAVPCGWNGGVCAEGATQGLCKAAWRCCHSPCCARLVWTPLPALCTHQHLPSAGRGVFPVWKSLCSPVCHPSQPLFLRCAISFLLPAGSRSCPG